MLLPGAGEVGAALIADPRVQGVVFTGSTPVARLIEKELAGRLTRTGAAAPAHRRDRRPQRDGGRFLGAARAGRRRRDLLGLRIRRGSAARPCASSACRTMSPTACSRCSRARWPNSKSAIRASSRSTSARSSRRKPATRIQSHIEAMRGRGHAVTQGELPRSGGARNLRRAGADRGRRRSPTSSARCSARCCMCCATGARGSTR